MQFDDQPIDKRYKFLVLKRGYVESLESAFLILSKTDNSDFLPKEAALELAHVVLKAHELESFPALNASPDAIFNATNMIADTFWGTADSTGFAYDTLYEAGWCDHQFPTNQEDCFFVHENADKWIFDIWQETSQFGTNIVK